MLTWKDVLGAEKEKPYFKAILKRLATERENGAVIYPQQNEIFSAFQLTALANIKVVILGQDPYHSFGQAHGLAFSVKPNVAIPPSLYNIYKELKNSFDDFTIPTHGYLQKWAEQGVFLLNTVLTVEKDKANSHASFGWQIFTDVVLQQVNQHREHVVFMLWGKSAQQKAQFIDNNKHYILQTSHPSPFSAHRGFLGCQHFSQANHYLRQQQRGEIDWNL